MFTFWLLRIAFRYVKLGTAACAIDPLFYAFDYPLFVEILFWFGIVAFCCTPLCLILMCLLLTLLVILEPERSYRFGCKGSFAFSAMVLVGWGLADGFVGIVSMVPEATLSLLAPWAICLEWAAWLLVWEPLIAGLSELSFVLMDKLTPAKADWLYDFTMLSTESI